MVDLLGQYKNIKEEIDTAILKVVRSGNFINGPEVKSFQNNLEKYLGVRKVIPCANGTDALLEIEKEIGGNVYTILQLWLHPSIIALREDIKKSDPEKRYKIDLKYFTPRGRWYHTSWKGDIHKSGGIATNIGIHFFDMLQWVFGDIKKSLVHQHTNTTASGNLILDKADVQWELSIDSNKTNNNTPYRLLSIDGTPIEFSDGFTDLHTRSYVEILAGRGFSLEGSKNIVQLVHIFEMLRNTSKRYVNKDRIQGIILLSIRNFRKDEPRNS